MVTLFDLHELPFQALFDASPFPWVWLQHLSDALRVGGFDHPIEKLFPDVGFDLSQGPVWIEPDVKIKAGAQIYGPAYIGPGVTIGHHALVRDGCLLAAGSSLGHAVEVKHSILLPGATCGHRNYIGDSVLGRDVNMGDGSGTANLRADRDPRKTIKVEWEGTVLDTGLRKFGALVGDRCSIGCRTTLQPGAVLGPDCLVYPNIAVGRTHAQGMVLMPSYTVVSKPRDPGR